MIKHKQPKKVWVDDGTEFLGAFKDLCNKRGIHLYSTFSEKKSAFAERNIRSLKNIIYRYSEEKWTYSYLDKLDSFVKTINSRVNRTIKLAPNKVTKKDVPRLVSLIANTTFSQKPKFFVGDLVRILKKEGTFGKGYKQTFKRFLRFRLSQHWTLQRTLLLISIKKLFRVNSINPNSN